LCVDEVELAVDVGLYALPASDISDQVDHALDGGELGPVRETTELEATFSFLTGGVVD
jgi:hypothetical protein